jgi:hypothetical protein
MVLAELISKNVKKKCGISITKNNYGLEQLASSKGFDINKERAWT